MVFFDSVDAEERREGATNRINFGWDSPSKEDIKEPIIVAARGFRFDWESVRRAFRPFSKSGRSTVYWIREEEEHFVIAVWIFSMDSLRIFHEFCLVGGGGGNGGEVGCR